MGQKSFTASLVTISYNASSAPSMILKVMIAPPQWCLSSLSPLLRREPKTRLAVVYVMLTPVLTKKILRPVALAAVMMFMTPVVGLVSASFKSPAIQFSSSETVVYKTNTSVAYKS